MAGKTGKGKNTRQKSRTGQSKAGIVFPVGRIGRYLREGRYAERVGQSGAIFMAATLDYLIQELLELSGEITKQHNKKLISPRHIQLAVR